jgi:hypothetical protein
VVVLQDVVVQVETVPQVKDLRAVPSQARRRVAVVAAVLEVSHQTEMAVLELKPLLRDRHSGLEAVVALAHC